MPAALTQEAKEDPSLALALPSLASGKLRLPPPFSNIFEARAPTHASVNCRAALLAT